MNTAEKFWIGTSWKMNKTLAEATDYAGALRLRIVGKVTQARFKT